MSNTDFKLGQTVYHRDVYQHQEPLKIVGIRETELELEGDYSGQYNVIQKQWMPVKGVSRIYNHAYKLKCRNQAVTIEELAKPITDRKQDNMTSTMFDLLDMVMILTNDVSLNPEYE
jgi:recombinational DNA repair protein RecR